MNELILAVKVSLFVTAVWVWFFPGNILGGIGDFMESVFKEWVCKIIFTCSVCMVPYWGGVFLVVYNKYHKLGLGFFEFLTVLVFSMAINTIIGSAIEYMKQKSQS